MNNILRSYVRFFTECFYKWKHKTNQIHHLERGKKIKIKIINFKINKMINNNKIHFLKKLKTLYKRRKINKTIIGYGVLLINLVIRKKLCVGFEKIKNYAKKMKKKRINLLKKCFKILDRKNKLHLENTIISWRKLNLFFKCEKEYKGKIIEKILEFNSDNQEFIKEALKKKSKKEIGTYFELKNAILFCKNSQNKENIEQIWNFCDMEIFQKLKISLPKIIDQSAIKIFTENFKNSNKKNEFPKEKIILILYDMVLEIIDNLITIKTN